MVHSPMLVDPSESTASPKERIVESTLAIIEFTRFLISGKQWLRQVIITMFASDDMVTEYDASVSD